MADVKRSVGHLANLDLNLLVVLRELIRERNVTRAAERIGITQPAASAALGRLRRHFGDDLLVRGRGGYLLSPLAAQLAEQVDAVCAAAERIFTASTRFDPATSTREFNLLMADYSVTVLGERLCQLMNDLAPRTRLHLMLVKEALAADIGDTVRFLDGVVAPPTGRFRQPGIRSRELFSDRWVCIVSAGNRVLRGRPPDLADLAELSWVAPYYRETGYPSYAPITRQLSLLGIRPHVAVRVESYQAVPHLVAGTDRVALIQQRLATRVAAQLDLRVLDCPGPVETIVETLWWHEHYTDDPAHTWLRDLIATAGHDLDHEQP